MDSRTGAGPTLPADLPRIDDEGQNGKLGHYDVRSMAERFGADVIPFSLRGNCPGCGTRRPTDGDPCPACGEMPQCTRQAGCPLHGSVEECPPDPAFAGIIERAQFCGALRGLADWFESNPGWPTPWAVQFSAYADPATIAAVAEKTGRGSGVADGTLAYWPTVPGIRYVVMSLSPPEVPRTGDGQ